MHAWSTVLSAGGGCRRGARADNTATAKMKLDIGGTERQVA